MQNTERQKFEENWKSAFEGAEMTPSDKVWNSVEVDLAGQESATMKKRVVFYQRLAAATVLFALLTGVYAFYIKKDSERFIVKNNVVEKPANSNENSNEVKSETPVSDNKVDNKTDNEINVPKKEITRPTDNGAKQSFINQDAPLIANAVEEQPAQEEPVTEVAINEAPTQVLPTGQATVGEQTTQEEPKKEVTSPLFQTAPLVATLEPQDEVEKNEKKKNRGENTWVALGAAAGNYSPNSGSTAAPSSYSADAMYGAPTLEALNAASNADNKTKIGTSYSVGMAVGKKFGRFVVQSGINLNKQQVDYTSSIDSRSQATNTAKASISAYSMADNSLTPTAAYTVNSSMEIVSIPVQAGYMIIDRKLGWQMNLGFSPDFFLRNTLVDRSGQRERFTQGAGSDSPYRSVNWSGLVNTELSYKIGEHYRLSLVPGVRYSFNSLLKDPGDSGKPLILDVGFRFKYLFD